jgi:hypothetical protein
VASSGDASASGERAGEHARGEAAEAPPELAEARGDDRVEALLERVEPIAATDAPRQAPIVGPAPALDVAALPALCTARVVRVEGREVSLALRGHAGAVVATVSDDVDRELVALAKERGDAVLVEVARGGAAVVVGVVQRRVPEHLELRAQTITIEADREVLLRAGRSALRIREDGDVELVGSRLLAMSRGLFRIVGRVLRLN